MIKAQIALANPDEVLVMIQITAPLKEWKEIKNQVNISYPGWKFAGIISTAISKIQTL